MEDLSVFTAKGPEEGGLEGSGVTRAEALA
jgi:hypothetical protein